MNENVKILNENLKRNIQDLEIRLGKENESFGEEKQQAYSRVKSKVEEYRQLCGEFLETFEMMEKSKDTPAELPWVIASNEYRKLTKDHYFEAKHTIEDFKKLSKR